MSAFVELQCTLIAQFPSLNRLLNKVKPFLANVPILNHLKTPETRLLFWCFQGV